MSRMIPSVIPSSCKSDAERKIFRYFETAEGTDDWVVLYSVMESENPAVVVGETDFVVLAPGLGCFALEVKGGGVSCDSNGIWSFTNRFGIVTQKARGPYAQANDGVHAMIDYLQKENPPGYPNEDLGKTYFFSGVMFPDVVFQNKDFGIEESQDEVFDKTDGSNVVEYIKRLSSFWLNRLIQLNGHINQKRILHGNQADEIAAQLRKRFDLVPALSTQIGYSENHLMSLTQDEYDAIDETEDNKHMLYLGAAGTGKTLVAIEQARRCKTGNICFLCFNKNLSIWLKEQLAPLIHSGSVTFAGNIHSMMVENIRKAGLPLTDVDFENEDGYSSSLVELFFQSLTINPLSFDYLIVDEFQDIFTQEYIHVLDAILRHGLKHGHFSFFADFKNQSLYHEKVSEKDALNKLDEYCSFAIHRLLKNCRNTPEICEQIGLLTGCWYQNQLRDSSKIKVEFRSDWNTEEDEAKQIDQAIDGLLSEGIRRENIVVLSPRKRENSCMRYSSAVNNLSFPRKKEVVFSTVHSFKGLESEAVILCDIDRYDENSLTFPTLYVGFSRARSLLLVFETKNAISERVALSYVHHKEKKV